VNDPYVHRAERTVPLARGYKLIEIAKRDRLARPGDHVVDLGAAPGGWAQALAERVGRPAASLQSILWKLRRYLELRSFAGISGKKPCFGDSRILWKVESSTL